MRAAIGLRLLLALTLVGWGQLAFASTLFLWDRSAISGTDSYTDPNTACEAYLSLGDDHPGQDWYNYALSETQWYCRLNNYGTMQFLGYANRRSIFCQFGDNGTQCNNSCDAPKTMVDGQCITPEPPQDCSSHNGKLIIAGVPGTQSGSYYSTPSVISYGGGEYVSSPDGKTRCMPNFDGSGTALCAARYQGTGECLAAGDSDYSPGESGVVDVTDNSSGQQKCFDFGGKELCLSPDNAGCDVYNGSPWCYQSGDNCGEVNGVFVCFPKTARQCTYSNGKLECIDTGNPQGSMPPSYIPPTSSDHPYNGGNADGDDTNDPKAPGAGDDTQYVGGGGPPADLSQTNDELRSLGGKLDKSTGLLESIRDLLTGDGDDSGNSDGSAADAEAEGAAVGTQVGDAITTHMDAVDEERNEEIEGVLDQLPNQVSQWFGADGSAVGLDFIDSILPTPVACADYVVPLTLNGYTADVRLPVCAIAPYKPILEWVIYCLTAIGAWRIGYSALRQEDSKAAKGGF